MDDKAINFTDKSNKLFLNLVERIYGGARPSPGFWTALAPSIPSKDS